jgi:hypothetical protein
MANAILLKPLSIVAATANATTSGQPIYVGNDYAGVGWSVAASSVAGSVPYYHYIDVDLGAALNIDTVMVFGLPGGLPADASVYAQGYTAQYASTVWSAPVTVPVYAGSSRITAAGGVTYMDLGAIQPAARIIRLVFQSTARFDLTIARIVVGTRIQLARNFGFGGSFGVRDLGSLDFSARGVLLRRRGRKLRTVSLTFSNVRREEVEAAVQPIIETCGNTEPIALVTDPSADPMRERRCFFGPLVGDLSTVWRNAAAWEWKSNLVSLF